MYIVLVYDIEESRVNKVNKYLKKYLHWIQNSVFEGELTEAQYLLMISGLCEIIEVDVDSVTIFKCKSRKHIEKVTLGVEKNTTDMII